MKKIINHLAGEYDPEERIQRCVLCGEILVDNRGAAVPIGQTLPVGFIPGPVYRDGNVTAVGDHEDGEACG